MVRKFLLVLLVCVFGNLESSACTKISHNSYVINFDERYSVVTMGIFDWVYSKCKYLFPEEFEGGFNLQPNVKITLLVTQNREIGVSFMDYDGNHVGKLSWVPTKYFDDHEIVLNTQNPYNTVAFSKALDVYAIKVELL